MGNVSDAVIQFLSSSKTRMTILGLLVLTTGVFTTIYLVGQQQDIRQQAATPSWDPQTGQPLPENCEMDYQSSENVTSDVCKQGEICVDMGFGKFKRPVCDTTPDIGPGFGDGGTIASVSGTGADGTPCVTGSQCASGVCSGLGVVNADGSPAGGKCGSGTQTGGTGGTGTGSTSSSGSTHCADTCAPQGKQYSCPSFTQFGGRTCSNSSLFGLCTRCTTASASTPTPTQPQATNTPTPSTGLGTPTPTALTPTPSAILTPVPTTNPACAGSTGKQIGCVCDINAHCASGFCGFSGTTKICQENGPATLTCDPNSDGVINILDFQWWREEALTGARTTKIADCFNPDGVVNLQDFQIWREIFITHERQPF